MELKYENADEGTVVTIKATNGSFVAKGATLLECKTVDGKLIRLKAHTDGTVNYDDEVKVESVLKQNDLVATISQCVHQVVIKDLCADCGKDLRERGGRAGERAESSAAQVSMIHHVPELIVSDKLAKQLGSRDQQQLLEAKKLVLLVDLDQTIIHTTNRPFGETDKYSDIFKYKLYHTEYSTKLRPYTKEFLKNISQLYQMHVVTYGERLYAHKIAELIDPEKIFFRERVLSRNELFSHHHKTANLKAIFPSGDQLIAIIDDRPDVWQFSDALVHVKPYRFFREVGDINAPSNSRDNSSEVSEDGENDQILEGIEHFLRDVHKSFYDHYEKTGEIKALKTIINAKRKEVLQQCVIVLSGIVPLGADLESSEMYKLCARFGAKVENNVSDQTTHVIAVRWGTDKVNTAIKKNISVVTPKWLYSSIENLKKANEEDFKLTSTTKVEVGKTSQSLAPELVSIDTMKKDVLMDMEHEVDEALSDEDGDEEEDVADEVEDESLTFEEREFRTESAVLKRRLSHPEEECGSSKRIHGEDELNSEEQLAEAEERILEEDDDDDEENNEETMDGFLDEEEEEEFDDMAALVERQMSEDG